MENVVVLGAGTMGHGIAQIAAHAGYGVTLVDVEEPFLAKGMARVRENVAKGVEKKKLTDEEARGILDRIRTSTYLEESVAGADVAIEAVPEKLDLKRDVFRRMSERAPAKTLLCTNTSSLSVTEIAGAVKDPERFLGMHFFNPPHLMKLVEVVRALRTSDEAIERARAFGRKLGKEVIVVTDSPGFASSRLGIALGMEAIRMLEERVASAEDIDRAMELGYNHPMGPLKLTDLVGLDVRLAIAEYLHAELGMEQFRPPRLLKKMVLAGKLGKKSGEGFYKY
ncbi:MAG: 3-hydroxyacyl-CoA dehydrogenase family protein [bacterium]